MHDYEKAETKIDVQVKNEREHESIVTENGEIGNEGENESAGTKNCEVGNEGENKENDPEFVDNDYEFSEQQDEGLVVEKVVVKGPSSESNACENVGPTVEPNASENAGPTVQPNGYKNVGPTYEAPGYVTSEGANTSYLDI